MTRRDRAVFIEDCVVCGARCSPEAMQDVNRILVTGGSGFVGTSVLRALSGGPDEVVHVGRRRVDGFECIECDLLEDRRAVRSARATHLLHLAWGIDEGAYWHSDDNIAWVDASMELLAGFRAAGGRRAVVIGTGAEGADTMYGAAKQALRSLFHAYCRQHHVSGAWARLFWPYGPHEGPHRLMPSMIRTFLNGETIRCGPGDRIRDFMYVDDVAHGLLKLLVSDVDGDVDFSGWPAPLYSIADQLRAIIGAGAAVFEARPSGRPEPRVLVGDPSALVTRVGYSPRTDLHAGLRQTVKWWQQAGVKVP